MSRNHFLNAANGKSDQVTLSKANTRKKTRAEFWATNLLHWNDRNRRITNAARASSEKIVRSSGLPSSKACAAVVAVWNPIHIDGDRDPRKKNQIRGTHNAADLLDSRATSK